MAQSIGTQKIDVIEMNIDALSISAHKIFDPRKELEHCIYLIILRTL